MGHALQILPNVTNRGPHSAERYFIEIRNRSKWNLQMGGERVLLYKRKYDGVRCPLFDKIRESNQQHGQDSICYGTGYVGGYFKPVEIFVSLISPSTQANVIEEYGRRKIYNPSSWTLWEPLLTNGDFIVRRNNQRLWITEVSQTRWKRFVLRQLFNTNEIERNSPIYTLKSP